MSNKDDIPTLARWLYESASDLIQYVMTLHTGNLLDAMSELVKERNAARAQLREEAMENRTIDRSRIWSGIIASLLKSYDELRKKYLETIGKLDLYPYVQQ